MVGKGGRKCSRHFSYDGERREREKLKPLRREEGGGLQKKRWHRGPAFLLVKKGGKKRVFSRV